MLLPQAPRDPIPEISVIYLRELQYAELPLYFGHQSLLGVVGLPFMVCLGVRPRKLALGSDTHKQEGKQHEGLYFDLRRININLQTNPIQSKRF